PRATVCHDRSAVSARVAGVCATNVPAPGRVTTRPSAASCPSARDTVTGLTPCARISSRLDGRRSPGRMPSIVLRSIATRRAVLLSYFMRKDDNATVSGSIAFPGAPAAGPPHRERGAPPDETSRRVAWQGTLLAGLGVLAFSGTLPATVFAVRGVDPYLVAFGRAAVAALAALICLLAVRLFRREAPPPLLPPREHWPSYAAVSVGVVFGFPLFSSLALDTGASSAHSAVVIG